MRKFLINILLVICLVTQAQVGIRVNEVGAEDGYTLIHPQDSDNTYLIDNEGHIVNKWPGNAISGKAFYLLENGLLLRTMNSGDNFLNGGGVGGVIELVKWDGTMYWQYTDSFEGVQRQHHDVQYLPNGNLLVLEWVPISQSEAIANGKDPSFFTDVITEVWSEQISEYKVIPTGGVELVWRWKLWDHVIQDFDETKSDYGVISENPGKMNINFRGNFNPNLPQDWLHANSLNYSEELDQILLSSPFLNEFYVIDHSTTTEEAATSAGGNSGQGGDFLYRWGNSEAYDRGVSSDRKLFGQHAVKWVIENNEVKALLYNNGGGRPEGNYSTIDIVTLPYDDQSQSYILNGTDPFGPAESVVRYQAPTPTDFYSRALSNASPLSNGNMLICEGLKGKVFEINDQNEIVWTFINPTRINNELCIEDTESAQLGGLFRAEKYSVNYVGLPLVAAPSNTFYWEENCVVTGIKEKVMSSVWPNPAREIINILSQESLSYIQLFDMTGRELLSARANDNNYFLLDIDGVAPGNYILTMNFKNGEVESQKIIKR